MRFTFILVLLLIGGLKTSGQSAPAVVGAQWDYSNGSIRGYNSPLGISIEGWIGDHLSLSYSLMYSQIGSDEYYFYTGGGQAAGVYLIRKAIRERSGLDIGVPLGIIAFILPESYGFRVPLGNKSQIGIFLSPYGFEYIKNRATGEEDYNISYELAARYYLQTASWIYLVPQIGMKSIYGDDELSVSFGLSVMFKVKQRVED